MARSVYVLGAILAVVIFAGVFSAKAQAQTLTASYYGNELAGSPTASGAPFDPYGYTAASLTYPLGTQLKVCYQGCVDVTVNDRGPYVGGRDIDLSLGAAQAIGLAAAGVAPVDVTVVGSGDTGSTSAPATKQDTTAPAPAPVSDTTAPATVAPAEATPAAPATGVGPLIYQQPQTVTYTPSVMDYTTYGTDTVCASGSGAVSANASAYSYGGTASATAVAVSY
ncbi:MAG: septal ring lytic transglycosylase RlpA family protein [Rubrobacteraceae bacterium]